MAQREARIRPVPAEELLYSTVAFQGYVDLENPVFGDSVLEVTCRLVEQITGEPCWLIPIPISPANMGYVTLTSWRASTQGAGQEPIDITAYDPLVAATHLLNRVLNGDDLAEEPQAGTER